MSSYPRQNLQRVVVLLQESGHIVGHAPGEVFEDELVALQPWLQVIRVRIAPMVFLGRFRVRRRMIGGGGSLLLAD